MNEAFVSVAQILARTVLTVIGLLQLAMLLRAIMSWFMDAENAFVNFLVFITEPIIMPFRKLFVKLNWFQSMPLDMGFLAGVLFLSLLSFILGFFSF